VNWTIIKQGVQLIGTECEHKYKFAIQTLYVFGTVTIDQHQ